MLDSLPPADLEESMDIAVIGLNGRFPGAADLKIFWDNLRRGVESIKHYSDAELLELGVAPHHLRQPNFVKVAALLDDAALFDAAFFGFSPREAELLDPQQRIFLESAWAALEHAGYATSQYKGMIGVYAGTSLSTYLLFNLLTNSRIRDIDDSFSVMIGNDKDFLSTRVSYQLDLKGPSIDLQTGCSTSLVAVHFACQSLLSYQCDMALAGGVSVNVPQRAGYYYQPGGINSPDGHCRSFDAQAQGTVFGSGVGIVVLKRLSDAIADRDSIYAIIKGSAINNDGAAKVGFTAPSIDGQAEVIARAQAIAGISAESISYIEAHGTATPLGDPVEVVALNKAFRLSTQARQFCALGSVKSNIGHLDAAAGVAGLIKTILALKHQQLPPTLNFTMPNPEIDFADGAFYVNAQLVDWPATAGPRRAGVSSFGIGGTNAHLIVEEAPPAAASSPSRPWQLLVLSAKTESALEQASTRLASYLKQTPESCLADVAHTLQRGRASFKHRRALVCQDHASVIECLEAPAAGRSFKLSQETTNHPVVFMFPGGGTQYINMGAELYQSEVVFREAVDRCASILQPDLGYDLCTRLYPAATPTPADSKSFSQTAIALPALFTLEYALAELWISWGVKPQALIGHSLGEYAAACLAGVFSLEDALALVALRGKLFERLPAGGMLSIALPPDEVSALMPAGLSIAAINAPSQCVVSGPTELIDSLAEQFTRSELEFSRVQIAVAAHSTMVEPILSDFRLFLSSIRLRPPTLPLISNLSGTWITPDEAVSPDYWVRHLRMTVRFADGIGELLSDPARVFLEIGPGQTLTTLTRLQTTQLHRVIPSIRHPYEQEPDLAFILTSLGKLWIAGVEPDWRGFYRYEQRSRVPLPTYPFERKRYWIEPRELGGQLFQSTKNPRIEQWFYLPSWKRAAAPARRAELKLADQPGRWLVFRDGYGIADDVVERLRCAHKLVATVELGERFEQLSSTSYRLNPYRSHDYQLLFEELRQAGLLPEVVIHACSLSEYLPAAEASDAFEEIQFKSLYSLLFLVQAMQAQDDATAIKLWVVSNHIHSVESSDHCMPEKAPMLGALKVIPQEYARISGALIDIGPLPTHDGQRTRLAKQILAEVIAQAGRLDTAYRGSQRWSQCFEPIQLETSLSSSGALRQNGVYVITGGLGGVGLFLAEHLALTLQAQLVLVGRTPLPPRETWAHYLAVHDENDRISIALHRLKTIEAHGGDVSYFCADVTNQHQLQSAFKQISRQFERIDGIIHMAGIAGEAAFKPLADLQVQDFERHFAAKAHALYTLRDIVKALRPGFCMLFSSNASILGGLGLGAYASANTFMDFFATSQAQDEATTWMSVNWDGWLTSGNERLGPVQTSTDQFAMEPHESPEAFQRAIAFGAERIIISTGDLSARIATWINPGGAGDELLDDAEQSGEVHPRPFLSSNYVPASNALEEAIVKIWQALLGIDKIGIHDNFFDLGGSSLSAIKVVSRLKRDLRIDVPVLKIFEGPTIEKLATLIAIEPAVHVYTKDRSRGERRRERLQKKLSSVD